MEKFQHTIEETEALNKIQLRIDSVYPGESKPAIREAVKHNLEFIDSLYEEVMADPNSDKAEQAIRDIQTVLTMVTNETEVPKENVEMLAAERLLKIAPYVEDIQIRTAVLDTVIKRSSHRSIDAERGYYLGLLHHFTSQSNYQRVEDQLQAMSIVEDVGAKSSVYDTESEEYKAMVKGVATYQPIIQALAEKYSELANESEARITPAQVRLLRTIKLLQTDFSEEGLTVEEKDEIHLAKLISYYYENQRSGEDELLLNLDVGETEKSDAEDEEYELALKNDAFFKVALRAGYHPSQEKIDKAKAESEPLVGFRVVSKSEYWDEDKTSYATLDDQVPMNNIQGEFLYQEIRSAKDNNDKERLQALIDQLYDEIWRQLTLTDEAAAKQFGSKDDIEILAYTLRDKILRIDSDDVEEVEMSA